MAFSAKDRWRRAGSASSPECQAGEVVQRQNPGGRLHARQQGNRLRVGRQEGDRWGERPHPEEGGR